MNIDLTAITENEVANFKGGEKSAIFQTFQDDKNKIMRIRLTPGASIGLHKHEGNSEIVYVLQGSGNVLYDGKNSPLSVGTLHYCPENHEHSISNTGTEDLIFLGIVPNHK
ncbi:MAG: cupin domain-containing protein [Bacteroidales bacterium]|nr:cupin domain-containing protein [Bacteroidales bacterium]